MLLLLAVVLVSLIGLIPGQSSVALGIELLVVSLVFAGVIGGALDEESARGVRAPVLVARAAHPAGCGTVPFVVGGASLIVEAGGGLYWTVAGILFATAGAVANAWVLLIEILR